MKNLIKATQQQTKEHNRNIVLKNLFDHESISRAEIARITGLTRTTVSELVTELIEEGLVHEIGLGESIGGKSPILLSLIPDSRYIIGLDLARNRFYGVVCDLRGQIVLTREIPVNDQTGSQALESVYQILDELVNSDHNPIVGIGIGTPGLIHTEDGLVLDAVNLDWKDLPLRKLLEARYHKPIFILNDSQAAAMGEFTYGESHQRGGNLILINARHGIGAGIIIHDTLFQGDGGGAGEIGHVSILPNGPLCRCGNHGCLETVASTQAVISQARKARLEFQSSCLPANPTEIQFNDLVSAFDAGDALARKVVLDAGAYMGMAISSLVGTLNIHQIILSGDMARFGKTWLKAVQSAMQQNTLSRLAAETTVELGTLGPNSVVLGASALVLNDYSLLFTHSA